MLDLIFNKLSNSSQLTSLVGDRIYSYFIEEQKDLPAVMFQMDSVEPLNTMEGTAKAETYSVVVACVSQRAGEAQQLMNITRAILDDIEGTTSIAVTGNTYNVADSRMTGMNIGSLMNGRLFVAEVEFDIDITNP